MNNLKILSKEKWNIEHFDGCPAFIQMTGYGFTKKTFWQKIPLYSVNAIYFSHEEGDWMSTSKDHKRIGSKIIRDYIKDKNVILSLLKEWNKSLPLMMEFFHSKYQNDLKKLSNKEFLDWADDVYGFYRNMPMPGFIDGYMFYADQRFDLLIKNFCQENNISDASKIFSILSAPIRPSFINEEQEELRKLFLKIKRKGFKKNLKNFLEKELGLKTVIKKHLLKYAWIKCSYAGNRGYSLTDMEKEMGEFDNKQRMNNLRDKLKLKKGLIRKYKFTKEIRAIIGLTEIFVNWQDQRKIYSLTFVTLEQKILKELAERAKIDFGLLKYSLVKELKDILKGKISRKELSERRKSSLFIFKNGIPTKAALGKEAKDFYSEVSKIKTGKVNEIFGMTASLGEVTGRVKIVLSSKYNNKVKTGDIMVAPMTRPEHLPAMRKAAAIITDDGGITCHAAIIARELNIPCIIGTKIATKVLRDGDLVKINGHKGTIKIHPVK